MTDVPRVYRHRHRRKVERLATSRPIVRAHPTDTLRRVGRRNLRDSSGESGDSGTNIGFTRTICAPRHCTRGVVGVGLAAEADGGLVHFRLRVEKARESRRSAEEENEEAGSEWIEGAEVTDAALTVNLPGSLDDVVRGYARGLVHQQKASGRLGLACFLLRISRRALLFHAPRRRPAS